MKITNKFWMGLGVLVVLSPLGLLLPEHFKAGSAWGEWGAGQIQKLVGYIPAGLRRFSNLWSAPFSGYTFRAGQGESILRSSLYYIFSAVIGVLVCVSIVLILGKFLSKKE